MNKFITDKIAYVDDNSEITYYTYQSKEVVAHENKYEVIQYIPKNPFGSPRIFIYGTDDLNDPEIQEHVKWFFKNRSNHDIYIVDTSDGRIIKKYNHYFHIRFYIKYMYFLLCLFINKWRTICQKTK